MKKTLFFAFMLLAASGFTACSSDDEAVEPVDELINVLRPQNPNIQRSVIDGELAGHGWKNYREYEYDIETGVASEHDMLGRGHKGDHLCGSVGYSVVDFYFGEKDFEAYDYNMLDGPMLHKGAYSYDEKNSVLKIGNEEWLLESFDGDTLQAIRKDVGLSYDNRKISYRVVYVRMTDEELTEVRKKFGDE